MILNSEIKAVTVYKDRALIERSAKQNLNEGEHTIVFGGLPSGIDTNSLQVKGGKQSVLQDLKVKDIYLDEISDEQKKETLQEIEDREYQIEELNDKIVNANQEKSFLLNLANATSENTKKSMLALLVPEKMNNILVFYNEKLNSLDDFIRNSKRELKKLEKGLNSLRNEIAKYNNINERREKQVILKVFVNDTTEVELSLSYIVYNASWTPVYDLRLNSNQKKLSVAYNAIVKQSTGEKWDNIDLKLSTARPQLSGTSPTLSPWFIDIFKYQPPPMLKKERAKAKKMDRMMSSGANTIAPEGIIEEAYAELEEEPMEIEEAKVETGATSVVFAIPGNNTIMDNYEEHKIGIASIELEAELEYNSIPKLSPFAYLTSKSKNTSDFPLLAGKTNIFLDNSFVSQSHLKLVAPNEKFKTSLGVDEGIKIENKLVNKFSKDEGLFSKKEKVIFEYKIEITNNKQSECKIKIKDQVPVSQSQDIKVELIEPKIKENTDLLKKMDDGSIEWLLKLPTGEKNQFNLKFSVEYPRGESLTGL